jgi:hypothetical protein
MAFSLLCCFCTQRNRLVRIHRLRFRFPHILDPDYVLCSLYLPIWFAEKGFRHVGVRGCIGTAPTQRHLTVLFSLATTNEI